MDPDPTFLITGCPSPPSWPGLRHNGIPRSSVDVAMSLQHYLIAGILACVPDRWAPGLAGAGGARSVAALAHTATHYQTSADGTCAHCPWRPALVPQDSCTWHAAPNGMHLPETMTHTRAGSAPCVSSRWAARWCGTLPRAREWGDGGTGGEVERRVRAARVAAEAARVLFSTYL